MKNNCLSKGVEKCLVFIVLMIYTTSIIQAGETPEMLLTEAEANAETEIGTETEKVELYDIVDFYNGAAYNYEDLLSRANALANSYKDILSIKVIGKSTDGNDIVAMTLTENVREDYGNKILIGMEAGIHGREGVSSVVMLETIELYCRQYYGVDEGISDDVAEILGGTVFKIILCGNPDGFNIARDGLEAVNDKASLLAINSDDYDYWKANAKGVDINRNFDCSYYDYETKTYTNQWGWVMGAEEIEKALAAIAAQKLEESNQNKDEKTVEPYNYARVGGYSNEPSPYNYIGPVGDSEIETRVIKSYFKKYSFRSTLSLHSKGEIIYFEKPYMPAWYREHTEKMVYEMEAINGYIPIVYETKEEANNDEAIEQTTEEDENIAIKTEYTTDSSDEEEIKKEDIKISYSAYGTFTDWAAAEFAKPAFTIELVPPGLFNPIPQSDYNKALEDFKQIPMYLAKEGMETGYYDYKVYINNVYYEDYPELEYAMAIAKEYGGVVKEYKGDPAKYIMDDIDFVNVGMDDVYKIIGIFWTIK